MTLTATRDPISATCPQHAEVLIKEARRRGRRHRLLGSVLAAALAVGLVVAMMFGIGGHNVVADPPAAATSNPGAPGILTDIAGSSFPVHAQTVDIQAVSCATGSCVLIGFAETKDHSRNFAVRYEGGHWSTLPVPLTNLRYAAQISIDFSCSQVNFCMLTGMSSPGDTMFTEYLHGGDWSLAPVPPPSSHAVVQTSRVSCVSSAWCMLAGTYANVAQGRDRMFADAWHAGVWSTVPVQFPSWGAQVGPHAVTALSCTSAESCISVGGIPTATGDRMVSAAWNGSTWRPVPVPAFTTPSRGVGQEFTGVSCPSGTSCLASASYIVNGGLFPDSAGAILRWNGTRWKVVVGPTSTASLLTRYPGSLGQVSCSTSSRCVTFANIVFGADVGIGAQVLARDGGRWQLETNRIPSGSILRTNGDACMKSGGCLVIGFEQDRNSLLGRPSARVYPMALLSSPTRR